MHRNRNKAPLMFPPRSHRIKHAFVQKTNIPSLFCHYLMAIKAIVFATMEQKGKLQFTL